MGNVCELYGFVYDVEDDEDNDEVWNIGRVLFNVDIEYGGGRRPRKLLLGAMSIKERWRNKIRE